jgi:hypothetical protein
VTDILCSVTSVSQALFFPVFEFSHGYNTMQKIQQLLQQARQY